MLGRRALPAGRLARLDATPDFHHELLLQPCRRRANLGVAVSLGPREHELVSPSSPCADSRSSVRADGARRPSIAARPLRDRSTRLMRNSARFRRLLSTTLPPRRREEARRPRVRAHSYRPRASARPNVRPASEENATKTRPWPSATVNHAIATSRPLALSAGPFTGQAWIRHCPVDRGRFAPRAVLQPRDVDVADLVRDRSRYATIGPSEVTAAAVGQHSQTRLSTTVSVACFQSRPNTPQRSDMSPLPCPPGPRLHRAAVEPHEPEAGARRLKE